MPYSKVSVGKRKLIAKSCIECEELKDEDHFSQVSDGYYQSLCKPCHSNVNNLDTQSKNKKSQTHAINSNNFWSSNEIKKMNEMYAHKIPVGLIAKELGRSRQSVYSARKTYSQEVSKNARS